jgi:AcrR family transcriptional regulator
VIEIQRSRLLTAALETVEERGYARMTIAEVTGRARVSRKTFYEVFSDLEDCFLALFEQALSHARLLAGEACERESGWCEAIRAALARLLLFMDEEPGLARLCVIEAPGAGERVCERRAAVLQGRDGSHRASLEGEGGIDDTLGGIPHQHVAASTPCLDRGVIW